MVLFTRSKLDKVIKQAFELYVWSPGQALKIIIKKQGESTELFF